MWRLIEMATLLLFLTAASLQAGEKTGGKIGFKPPTVFCLALSPDGKTLALIERKGAIRLWDIAKKEDLRSFPIDMTPESYISTAHFSPDGKRLVIAGRKRLESWDIETGKLHMSFKDHGGEVYAARFSMDGKTLFTGGREITIRVWDADAGKEKFTLKGHGDSVTHLAMPAKGDLLASGAFRGEIKIWNVDAAREIASLDNGGPVYGLAFSSDGTKLVSNIGTAIHLWDVKNRKPLGKFTGAKTQCGPRCVLSG